MSYTTDQIRNIAVAGHGSTGKTSLVENLLFIGGEIDKPETVESGKTVSDFTEEEFEHKMSVHSTLSHVLWKGHKVNFLDTPGAADFVGEVLAAFRTAESSVLVVDSEAGVQIETIKLWRALDQRNRPRIIFINKMDKERADFARVLKDLNEKFSFHFIPVTIPMTKNGKYQGIIDLIHMKAFIATGPGKKEVESDIPPEYLEEAKRAHEELIDAAAEGDDELTEKFLEGKELTIDEAIRGLGEDLRDHKAVPVFCGSALHCSGVTALLDIINIIAPSPLGLSEGSFDKEHNETEQSIDIAAPVSFFSFKTSLDQFAGKLSFIKVITGVLKPETEVLNVRENKKDRIGKLYMSQGKKLTEVADMMAGDIGIVAKVASAHTNDTFSEPSKPREYRPLKLPQPTYHLSVFAQAKKDEDKLGEFLARCTEEDKTLRVQFDHETRETVLSGMGDMHLSLVFEKLRKTNKIEVTTQVPKVAYRETMGTAVEAEFTHKKQTGGHGQYAKVLMKFRPIERGENFRFVNDVHGGAVSRNFIPAVEKGVQDGMAQGILAGFPVVDIEATLLDGKEHPVDSSDMSFQLAGRGALKEAMAKAKCLLLEPVMELHSFVEDKYLGDILSDISGKRGRVLSQNPLGGGIIEVISEVPQAELLRYAIDLRSMTSGTGSFEVSFSRYSPLGGKQAEEVIKAASVERNATEH